MIILTGGAGFIGSALLAKLNAEGFKDVLVVDNLAGSEKWKNLIGKTITDFIHKDEFYTMVKEDALPNRAVEAVIHLGACTSTTQQDANYMMHNNFRYSKLLAEWCLRQNVRFLYASSAATYGDGSIGFSDAVDLIPKLHPLNIYGFSKHLFDLWSLNTKSAEHFVGLKFFNVFGPNEYHKGDMASVAYKAYHEIKETGELGLFKSYLPKYQDGEQKRDFLYIKDCVEVIWWFLKHPQSRGIFNLGSGKARSWNELGFAVFNALGVKPKMHYKEMPSAIRDKYQYYTQAEMGKLRAAGCSVEFHSLEEAVEDYVRNYLDKGKFL